MNTKVIYTAIFGKVHYLHTPKVKSEGYDYICFTDNPELKSDFWDIRLVTPIYEDPTRNARKYKSLPHRYLSVYTLSIWVDGDLQIIEDLDKLNHFYGDPSIAVLDHKLCGINTTGNMNSRDCIYKEAQFIKWLGDNHPEKHYKDNIDVIWKQMERYNKEQYPPNNGLARTSLLIRRHNNPKVIKIDEAWWEEMKYWSRRDQLSFPYVCWKNKFTPTYIQEDIDQNKWVMLMKKWRKEQEKK